MTPRFPDGADAASGDELLQRTRTAPETVDASEIIGTLDDDAVDQQTVARALLALCESDQNAPALAVSELESRLDADETVATSKATYLLGVVATEYPRDARAVASSLIELIQNATVVTPNAFRALAAIATAEPSVAVDAVSAIRPHLTDEPLPIRGSALAIVDTAADADPEAVESIVPVLMDVVTEESSPPSSPARTAVPWHVQSQLKGEAIDAETVRQYAMSALHTVAEHDCRAVTSELPALGPVVNSESVANPYLREQVLDLLWTVARNDADAVVPLVDALTAVVDDSEELLELRAKAARTLALLADSRFDTVTATATSTIPSLGDLLEADDPRVCAAAAGLLSYLAEQDPVAARSETPRLVSLLDGERHLRASAVWALEPIDTAEASDALKRVVETDPSPELRALAADFLDSD